MDNSMVKAFGDLEIDDVITEQQDAVEQKQNDKKVAFQRELNEVAGEDNQAHDDAIKSVLGDMTADEDYDAIVHKVQKKAPEAEEVESTSRSSLKGLVEETETEAALDDAISMAPPSASLLQVESQVEAGVEA